MNSSDGTYLPSHIGSNPDHVPLRRHDRSLKLR